jgi:hypothetical protein
LLAAFSCSAAQKWAQFGSSALCVALFVINFGKCIGKLHNYQTLTQIMRLEARENEKESLSASEIFGLKQKTAVWGRLVLFILEAA